MTCMDSLDQKFEHIIAYMKENLGNGGESLSKIHGIEVKLLFLLYICG